MGQNLIKTEDLEDLKNLNSGLKDYLFLNKKDAKSAMIGKKNSNLLLHKHESIYSHELVSLSLSLAIQVKENQQDNCNFNSSILLAKVSNNVNQNNNEMSYIQNQLELINMVNQGKKLFKDKKELMKKNSSSQLFFDNENLDIKNNKSVFVNLDNSLDKNFQNQNSNTLNKMKNLQNLEISKINTNKTVNQTYIMDDDFGFDDSLKTDTTRLRNKQVIENLTTQNNENNFQTTIKSKKKDISPNSNPNKVQVNENSFDKQNLRKSVKLKNGSPENIKKTNPNKLSNPKFLSKGSKFEDGNILQNIKPTPVDNKTKSKPKIQINPSINLDNYNSPLTPTKTNNNKAFKNEKKPVVNIKIDLRDIVREDIIDSYIQNTNSIINNSNMKTSLSPINNYAKAPFAQKKTQALTPTKKKDFKNFVENCSNPNKKNFHLDNAKKKQNLSNIKKKEIIPFERSMDKLISKSDISKSNIKNSNQSSKVQINKSNENLKRPSVNIFINENKNKKVVCLDISDDGEIIDHTEKPLIDNIFAPKNIVKHQFKPKKTKKSIEINDSFGKQNSASSFN